LSRKTKVEWFAVAFTLAAGCTTTDDAKRNADAAVSSDGDASADASGDNDPNKQDGGENPYVLVPVQRPDGGTTVTPEEPSCGASSIAAEQVVVEKQVEISEEVPYEEEYEETYEEEYEETYEVEVIKPASLYIMLDKSMSMAGYPTYAAGTNIWPAAKKAVRTFIGDTSSNGLGVGLQYFPISGGQCGGSGYSTPTVAMNTLPGNAAALRTSLGTRDDGTDGQQADGGSTPMEGALKGVTKYCLDFKQARPTEQCVAVLVTDGNPNGCNQTEADLVKIAADARTAGVITFAVGLKGASFTFLDNIARAGGAPDCDDMNDSRYSCDVSSDANKLSDALAKIREKTTRTETRTETRPATRTATRTSTRTVTRTETRTEVEQTAVPCEWNIPKVTEGTFDRDNVNIRWSVDNDQTTLLRVENQADCRADGWYFDNPSAPQRLIACEQTCEEIKTSDSSKIDILLGCATIVPG
jgi:hypothetical protein